jgi:protein SCO1/2
VLPEEGFVEFFRREVPPEKMAEQIGCFLEKV